MPLLLSQRGRESPPLCPSCKSHSGRPFRPPPFSLQSSMDPCGREERGLFFFLLTLTTLTCQLNVKWKEEGSFPFFLLFPLFSLSQEMVREGEIEEREGRRKRHLLTMIFSPSSLFPSSTVYVHLPYSSLFCFSAVLIQNRNF